MVDFNSETTIGTPALDVMRIYLLECKANTEEAWQWYRDKDFGGQSCGLEKIKSRLEHWYFVIEPMIDRHWEKINNEIKKDEIEYTIENGSKEQIKELIKAFNRLLDALKITRLDTRVNYNRQNIEEENEATGVNG